jgi:hypothetical protein
MEQKCEKCGSPMDYKEGYSKTKKKNWAGWFCEDKDNCGYVEWTDANQPRFVKQNNQLKVRQEPDWDSIREQKADEIRENVLIKEAGENTRAMYNKGDITAEQFISAYRKMLKQLKEDNENETTN